VKGISLGRYSKSIDRGRGRKSITSKRKGKWRRNHLLSLSNPGEGPIPFNEEIGIFCGACKRKVNGLRESAEGGGEGSSFGRVGERERTLQGGMNMIG